MQNTRNLTLDELRAAQRDAIRSREWLSVEILQRQIDAIERAATNVIDLANVARGRRPDHE